MHTHSDTTYMYAMLPNHKDTPHRMTAPTSQSTEHTRARDGITPKPDSGHLPDIPRLYTAAYLGAIQQGHTNCPKNSTSAHPSTPSTLLKKSLTLPTSTSSPLSLSTAATKPPSSSSTIPSPTPVHNATTRRYLSSSSELRLFSRFDCSRRRLLSSRYAASRARKISGFGREVT